MIKSIDVQIAEQLSVEHAQHVAIEGRGDPGIVVVGRNQPIRCFDQIDPEQERLAGSHRGRQTGQELSALGRRVVPDRATQKREEPGAWCGKHVEVVVEVRHCPSQLQRRVLLTQTRHRLT